MNQIKSVTATDTRVSQTGQFQELTEEKKRKKKKILRNSPGGCGEVEKTSLRGIIYKAISIRRRWNRKPIVVCIGFNIHRKVNAKENLEIDDILIET